jgi:DNA-binding LacI/PurR family transcriptional regulator
MVTLKDIADKAGVNISSVSKALNHSKEISESKKKEIQRIAAELNYIPNLSAKALAGKGTNSIGVILPEIRSNSYARIMNCIETELNDTSYSIIMSTTNFRLDSEMEMLNVLCSRAVDGIILIGVMHEGIEDYVTEIRKRHGVPVLFLESHIALKQHDYINIDNKYGIDMALKHFKSIGHQEIGFISDSISAGARLPLFKEAMAENNLTLTNKNIRIGEERFEIGGYLRMKEFLKEGSFPGAFFASYDDMAIGAMKAVEEAGLSIPADISIIGFDNIRVAEYLTKPLTTIVPPIEEMVSIGVRLILDKISSNESRLPNRLILQPSLAIRETA